jgi:SSS family solute:Na+ symporter
VFGLHIIDLVVIVLYFAFVIVVGMRAMRRIRNQEDYFLAGRRFGKFIQTFAAFGQGTSADNAVGVTTTTFTNGIAGVWSSLLYLFATPMYWMVMPWMRRLRLLSLGDFFEERYGSRLMAGVYALIGSFCMMTIISVGFSAMTKTIVALAPKSLEELSLQEQREYEQAKLLDELRAQDFQTLSSEQQEQLEQLSLRKPRKMFSHINPNVLIWIICGVVMAYAIAGGLEAAFLTDTLQGLFIILLSVLLFPFAWSRINSLFGGLGPLDALQTVHSQLPESFFEIFGSPATVDFTWYYIGALTVMVTINVVVQPNSLVATGSAKSEYECRFGFVAGSYLKRFCTVLWGFFALSAVVLYHDRVHDPDLVWGYATRDLLGSLGLGLVGLMTASLMAALMSTADCMMITASSLLTHNVYRPLLPGRAEKHYVIVGRVIGGLVVIGGALIATQFDSILQQLKLWWELNVMVAASFWLGMKWRRANKTAAWCSILTAAIMFFVLPILLPVFWGSLRTNRALLTTTRPRVVVRTYQAHQMDVVARQRAIERWDALQRKGQTTTARPESLQEGQTFDKTYQLPKRSIFWTKGIALDQSGRSCGSGMLSLELVLLDKIGFDLQENPYALNETIRIMIRTATPFLILIVVSFLTELQDQRLLDKFFVKMKTPVRVDTSEDARELELSYNNPHRFDGKKLFPGSYWEFDRWTKTDLIGFLVSAFVAIAVIVFLMALLSVGR